MSRVPPHKPAASPDSCNGVRRVCVLGFVQKSKKAALPTTLRSRQAPRWSLRAPRDSSPATSADGMKGAIILPGNSEPLAQPSGFVPFESVETAARKWTSKHKGVPAEDLSQEAHRKLVRILAPVVGGYQLPEKEGNADAYVWTVVRSVGIDLARHRLAARRGDGASRIEIEPAALSNLVVAQGPREVALPDAVIRALGALPEEQRLTLCQRYLEGLSTAEMAEREGLSVEAIRVRLCRSLKAIRHLLGLPEYEEQE